MACAAANEAVVVENVRTISMRAKKSLAEKVMYCRRRFSVHLYLTKQWAWGLKALEGQRTTKPKVLMLELKRLEGVLMKLVWEAPQCAQL